MMNSKMHRDSLCSPLSLCEWDTDVVNLGRSLDQWVGLPKELQKEPSNFGVQRDPQWNMVSWNSTTMKSKVHRDSLGSPASLLVTCRSILAAHSPPGFTLRSFANHPNIYLWAQVHTVTFPSSVSVSFVAGTQMESRIVAKHYPSVQLLPNNIRGTFSEKAASFQALRAATEQNSSLRYNNILS